MSWVNRGLVQVWDGEPFPEPEDDELEPYRGYRGQRTPAPLADRARKAQALGYTNSCADCSVKIRTGAKRCYECHSKLRKATAKPTRVVPADDDIDQVKVEQILDGTAVWCNRAERYEAIRRWGEAGLSWKALHELTGWNVYRDRRQMPPVNTQLERQTA